MSIIILFEFSWNHAVNPPSSMQTTSSGISLVFYKCLILFHL